MSPYTINKNVNVKSLLDKHYETLKLTESALVRSLVPDKELDSVTYKTGEFYVQTAYTAIYARVAQEMQSQMRILEAIRQFYLVEVILNQITDDALAPKAGSDDIFKFTSNNPEIQRELDDLTERLKLNELIEDITPDLCFYGEYALETEIDSPKEVKPEETLSKKGMVLKGRGVVDLKDKVDQGTIVSLAQDGKLVGYLNRDKWSGRVSFHYPSDYIKFTLGGARVKVNLDSWIPDSKYVNNKELAYILDAIPRFLRVGKSVFYGMTAKIRELELLEKLIPATKINRISQGNILGIQLPENYDIKSGMAVAREMEGMINKKVNVDPQTGEITAEAVLSIAGRTRVLPVFGDKGDIQKFDTKNDDIDDIAGQANDLRSLLCDSIGVPAELIFKNDGDGSKNEILKRHSKYLRKLKRVQKAIAEGLKQLAKIHLANRGYEYDEKDIQVVFINALIEIDNIEKLEYTQATVSILKDINDFFMALAEEGSPFKKAVKLEKFAEYMDENLKLVGLADAISLKKEGGAGVIEPAEQDDDMGMETTPDDELAGLEDDEIDTEGSMDSDLPDIDLGQDDLPEEPSIEDELEMPIEGEDNDEENA